MTVYTVALYNKNSELSSNVAKLARVIAPIVNNLIASLTLTWLEIYSFINGETFSPRSKQASSLFVNLVNKANSSAVTSNGNGFYSITCKIVVAIPELNIIPAFSLSYDNLCKSFIV